MGICRRSLEANLEGSGMIWPKSELIQDIACVQGSTNCTNGISISFKVLTMVPLVIPLVPMVMPMVPLALPMVPLVSQWHHWLPMVPLVKLLSDLAEIRTYRSLNACSRYLKLSKGSNQKLRKSGDTIIQL